MKEYKKPEEIIDPTSKGNIVKWKKKKIKTTEMVLYYRFLDKKKEMGFYFYCIKHCVWNAETDKVIGCEGIYHGVAYWDGIRHFYVGDNQTENYGYLYYLNLNNFILALKELEKLEEKYCRND